jgi:hypothetical protein
MSERNVELFGFNLWATASETCWTRVCVNGQTRPCDEASHRVRQAASSVLAVRERPRANELRRLALQQDA